MPNYSLSPEAITDLREMFDRLAAANLVAADRLEDQLKSAMHFLTEWPNAGRERPELGNPPLKFWSSGKFLIVYLKRGRKIEIAAVLHAARDIPALLSERQKSEST